MTIVVVCAVCTKPVGISRDIAQGVVLCERCAIVVTDPEQQWAASQALAKVRRRLVPEVDPVAQPGLFEPVATPEAAKLLRTCEALLQTARDAAAPVTLSGVAAEQMARRLLDESGPRIGGSFGLVDRLDAIASDIRDASADAAALDAITPVLASLYRAADQIRTAQVTLLRSHP